MNDESWREVFDEFDIQMAERITFGDGRPADIRPMFWPGLNFLRSLSTHDGRPLRPKIILSASPLPNAETVLAGHGVLRLNLGLVVAFAALPAFMKTLLECLDRAPKMALDEIAQLARSSEHLRDLDALLQCWRASATSGWTEIAFSPRTQMSLDRPDVMRLITILEAFVIGHELGHMEELYPAPPSHAEWSTTFNALFSRWVTVRELRSQKARERIPALSDPLTLARWEEEVRADISAGSTASKACHSPRDQAYLNCGTGILYGLLGLLERFERAEGVKLDFASHPPADYRLDAFTFFQARYKGVAETEYLARHWGAGVLAMAIMREATNAYFHDG